VRGGSESRGQEGGRTTPRGGAATNRTTRADFVNLGYSLNEEERPNRGKKGWKGHEGEKAVQTEGEVGGSSRKLKKATEGGGRSTKEKTS